MLLEIFGFLNMSFIDILDILMVALIIYFVFRWIRHSAALNIFVALILILVIKVIVTALNMKMMTALMDTFIDVGVLALIVIFQPEIRHFLNRIGSNSRINAKTKSDTLLNKLFGIKGETMGNEAINELAEACRSMSEQKTGALIVLPRKKDLDYIIETGDRIDADINRRLIMNLFFKNSPLHDGAIVIRGNRIVAARCTLPMSNRTDIPASYGMRHKAAIGMSEDSDADIVLVSEQTGHILFISEGKVTPIKNINELILLLTADLSNQKSSEQ